MNSTKRSGGFETLNVAFHPFQTAWLIWSNANLMQIIGKTTMDVIKERSCSQSGQIFPSESPVKVILFILLLKHSIPLATLCTVN